MSKIAMKGLVVGAMVLGTVYGCASDDDASDATSSLTPATTASSNPGTTVETPSTSSEPATTPASSTTVELGEFVIGSPLDPGTYSSKVFVVPTQFTIPDGWKVFEDEPGQFGLAIVANDAPCLCIWRNVYAASTTCAEEPEPAVGTSAEEITAWLASHAGLETSEPSPVTVGGLQGFVIDVAMDPTWTEPCPFSQGNPTVMTLVGKEVSAGVHWGVAANEQQREYILDTEPTGNIAINVEVCCGVTFDQRMSDVTPVIDSLTFN